LFSGTYYELDSGRATVPESVVMWGVWELGVQLVSSWGRGMQSLVMDVCHDYVVLMYSLLLVDGSFD
jgi:hypothetical protein